MRASAVALCACLLLAILLPESAAELEEAAPETVVSASQLGRRLKPGGAGGSDAGETVTLTPKPKSTYQGPGQMFGMVLLIVSMSLFSILTFGSICIGNIYLSRKAKREERESASVSPAAMDLEE
mmetsp:Transcript_65822/g.140833  ORF Transcript_65822/g.140833 Transcript_65822/m.140833 type:complete len:125 (+) Transcript_65822:84-458(+)